MRDSQQGNHRQADAEHLRQVSHLSEVEQIRRGGRAIYRERADLAQPGGEVLAWFIGRKIRTFPALTGDSSYLRLATDGGLAALGRNISSRLGLTGVFKMDFKRHPESGRFYLLEINTRFNLWHYVGAKNGVNLPQVAYDFLTAGKRPATRTVAKTRYRWLCLRFDWLAYKDLKHRSELSFLGWMASLAYRPMLYDIFSWRDPMPFLRYWAMRIRAAAARRMHRWLATASAHVPRIPPRRGTMRPRSSGTRLRRVRSSAVRSGSSR
jgi:predicted ATP-grasp superfamily ATP-dependent carboligase